jgi:hypothetical protein
MGYSVVVWASALAAVSGLALAAGWTGLLYAPLYLLAVSPGVVLGGRLVGRDHPAGWILGGILGYGIAQIALWVPIAAHIPSALAFVGIWCIEAIVLWVVARCVRSPILDLGAWTPADGRALALALLLVPLVMSTPYRNLGRADETGARQYRAYFTADFVWHTALAAELGRYDTPPRNPYMASRDLHYYWTYFLLPAVVAAEAPPPLDDVQGVLKANAYLSGLLMVGVFFLFVRTAVPSPGIAMAAVALGVLAASAEGTFVLQQLWWRGIPLAVVEDMNIDAITAWQFGGLRVDNIPRSLWYTPQHAFSCALGLVAAVVAATSGSRASNAAVWTSGIALGLSTCFNPLLGGMFSLIYGLSVAADALITERAELGPLRMMQSIARHAKAAIPVLLALAWAAINGVAEGAGSAVTFGFGGFASNNTLRSLFLSTGPLLVPAMFGLWLWRGLAMRAAWVSAIGVVLALGLMHFVTLSEASWVGFRAGQLLLLMLPVLVARLLWRLAQAGGPWVLVLTGAILVAGLPTTLIDTYNAQDTSNRRQGPGFRWTLPVSSAQQEAFSWIRENLPEDATVQMEPMLRAREHWSLIPTFAQRRMTAGLPISLLPMPEYQRASSEVQRLFQTANAREAWYLARGRGIDYLYVDGEDRAAYPDGVAKFATLPYFRLAFENGEVWIYQITGRDRSG